MTRRLVATGFIFVCTSIAWFVLGGTIHSRTYTADATLKRKVEHLWGSAQVQQPPDAFYLEAAPEFETTQHLNGTHVRTVNKMQEHPVPLDGSDIQASLQLDHRQKGLLWYATYTLDFGGSFQFKNDTDTEQLVYIRFLFPGQNAIYDGFRFTLVDLEWESPALPKDGQITGAVTLAAGETATLNVGYRTHGLDQWGYALADGVTEIRDFHMRVATDFEDVDFPDNSISPTSKSRDGNGWVLAWDYSDLIAGVNIGIVLPNRLQPGPLAGRISFFAPVSLFFFMVVVMAFSVTRQIDIHPMHFFFLSAAFFAFHLLLAYLVDHITIHFAFILSSLISIGLVVSYLRAAIGKRFAYVEAAGSQFLFLILFSYAFFYEGYTGLTVTLGAVATLFVLMQMTAKVDWNEVFQRPKA